MRVLHLIDHLGLGGAQTGLVRLAEARGSGVDFRVTSLSNRALPETTRRLKAAGVETRLLGLTKVNPLGLGRLRAEIANQRPDVVQTHLEFSNTFGVAAAASLGSRRPVIVRTFHNIPQRQYAWPLFVLSRVARRWVDREVALSEDIASAVRAIGIPQERIQIIAPIVNSGAVRSGAGSTRNPEWRNGASRVVGAVGRFVRQKNFGTLVDAMPILLADDPQTRLLFIGEGPLQNALESRVKSMGLSQAVTFAGYQSERAAFYGSMDVLAMSSSYEGLALSILEAMAHGVPVVATRVPGCRNAIRDEVDGLLVAPDEPEALAAAILRVFREPDLTETRVAEARTHVAKNFRSELILDQIEKLYNDLASSAAE